MAQLKDILQYAKANPNDPRNVELFKQLKSGALDQQGVDEGVDLSGISNSFQAVAEDQGFVSNAINKQKERFGDVVDTAKGIGSAVKNRFGNVVEAEAQAIVGERSPIKAGFDIAGETASAVTDVGGELIKGAAKMVLPQSTEDNLARVFGEGVESVVETEGAQTLLLAYDGLDEDTKRDITTAGQLASTFLEIITLGGAKAVTPTIKRVLGEAIDGVSDQTGKVVGAVKTKVKGAKDAIPTLGSKTDDVAQAISPKLTAQEQRAIIKEGRVVSPKDSILFGKRADVVTPTQDITRASKIIEDRVTNAKDLDTFKLSNEIEILNKETIKTIRPQFKEIKVSKNVTDDALTRWDELKKFQADEPEFLAFAGGKKVQERFEGFLKEVKTRVKSTDGKFRDKDLDDVWAIRKRYDNSISDNVKQATDASAPSTQLQRDMWLQNREVLNDIIFDLSDGLEKTAKESFTDMSLLYEARQNLITKGKIDVKGKTGLLSKKSLIRGAVGIGLGKFLLFD